MKKISMILLLLLLVLTFSGCNKNEDYDYHECIVVSKDYETDIGFLNREEFRVLLVDMNSGKSNTIYVTLEEYNAYQINDKIVIYSSEKNWG